MVGALITLPMGITQSKEYAELEWPLDILIAVVWIAYGWLFFGTIAKRRVKHIYVANWFFGAYVIAVGLLHVVNNLVMPASLWKRSEERRLGHECVGTLVSRGWLTH